MYADTVRDLSGVHGNTDFSTFYSLNFRNFVSSFVRGGYVIGDVVLSKVLGSCGVGIETIARTISLSIERVTTTPCDKRSNVVDDTENRASQFECTFGTFYDASMAAIGRRPAHRVGYFGFIRGCGSFVFTYRPWAVRRSNLFPCVSMHGATFLVCLYWTTV